MMFDKLRSSFRKRGVLGTVRAMISYALAPMAPYYPNRLAKRARDRYWDLRHGVDTSAAVDLERLRIEANSVGAGSRYQATGAGRFHKALRSMSIPYEDFVFIDFGSGKGKCLLMASEYPFRKAVGVEFSKELVEIAQRNLRSYRSGLRKCRDVEILACDATEYALPEEPSLYYFYNPFNAAIMRRVLDNIRTSIESHPRQVYLLYYNPVHRDVFDHARWLTLMYESSEYCIYRSR